MARARTDRTSALAFDAITVEGALISPAMLARIAQHQADGQTDTDYGIPKGLTLRDEIARYFRIGQALFKELTVTDTPSTTATVNFIEKLLRDVFGFTDIRRVGTRTVGDRQFTITLEGLGGGRVPVVVVPPADDIDRPSTHLTTDGRRRSAASAPARLAQCRRERALGSMHEWHPAAAGARQCEFNAPSLYRGRSSSHLRKRCFCGLCGAVAAYSFQPIWHCGNPAVRLRSRTVARRRPERRCHCARQVT